MQAEPEAQVSQRVVVESACKAVSAAIKRAILGCTLMLARAPVGLLYNPMLLQIFERLLQASTRNLAAHRHTLDALRAGNADAAAEWTRKHMVDFERGFAVAGLSMRTPIAQPT